jgi:RNA polymerase sigma-70 factor (ECF subfamily)
VDSIKKIIKGCLKNNRPDQYRLYSIFSKKMYGICLRYADNQDEANDILQEGFIKVFDKLDTFRGQGSLEGWITRVIVNTAIEKIRGRVHFIPIDELSENGISNDENLGPGNIGQFELLKLIQDLPERYRLVFNLSVIEGLNHKEIAKMLDITESTSRSNLTRARSLLRKCLKEESTAVGKAI